LNNLPFNILGSLKQLIQATTTVHSNISIMEAKLRPQDAESSDQD